VELGKFIGDTTDALPVKIYFAEVTYSGGPRNELDGGYAKFTRYFIQKNILLLSLLLSYYSLISTTLDYLESSPDNIIFGY
jgi:hypothetical protein